MNKLIFTTCFLAGGLFAFTSCNNTANSKTPENKVAQESNHSTHDHASHDHSQHQSSETAAHSEAPNNATSNLAQGEPSATIPLFTFYKVKSGISFNNQDLGKGKKSIFILFDPSCSHCRTEANALGKSYDKIKNVNLYFVSMNDPALMVTFLETFAKELVGKPNVEVLYDKNQDFIQKFHVPKQFPANYVYSKNGKLETYWDGDKDIKDIVAAYNK